MAEQSTDTIRCSRFRAAVRHPGFLLTLVLVLSFAFRLIISALLHSSTFDTATVGLMALNILDGERPLFFYGQQYMGALEAYLAAALFRVFGFSMLSLSLSPILFSIGWIAGTYLLFTELLGRRAGLAAALVLAIPGWQTLWYNIASYGGYPGAFCFGTWALWLCLRTAQRDLSRKAEWIHILSIGFLAGIALWTNYQSASYLLTGSFFLGAYLVRNRRSPRIFGKFAVGGGFFAFGFWPVIVSLVGYEGTHVAQWEIKYSYISKTANIMSERCLPHLLYWPLETPLVVRVAVKTCLILASCLYVWRVVFASDRKDRLRALVPLLFSVVFLMLYLPHSMASLGAPRYLIPLWSMILCAMFAATVTISRPWAWFRWIGWGLLTIWLAYNAVYGFVHGLEKAPEKRWKVAARNRIVENARRTGATSVMIVGGPMLGYRGQVYTLYSKAEIRFVSAFDERHQPSAQKAEADSDIALACDKSALKKVRASLNELAVDFRVLDDPNVCLLYDLKVPRTGRKSVPTSEMRVTLDDCDSGEAADLTDRIRETHVEGPYASRSGFTIDLVEERTLDGLWLTAPDWYRDGLPTGYTISVSTDGQVYQVISEIKKRISVSYISGKNVYFKGYFGLLECRFDDVRARYVRLKFTRGPGDWKSWQINEVFVFERTGTDPDDLDAEVDEIASALKRLKADFTVCDRWLSARLWTVLPSAKGRPAVYPRFNPSYRSTLLRRRIKPGNGLCIAPSAAVADECALLLQDLYGENVIAQRLDFSNYSILVLRKAGVSKEKGVSLIWNGHTLLKTRDSHARF